MSQKDDAQNADIAFTLVARNKKARQMWADPHNSSRYAVLSHDSQGPIQGYEKIDTQPALQFRFSAKPNDYAKGFLLGSDDETCDVVLGFLPDVDSEMVAFTYNQQYELIMNVTSIQYTTVKFNDQPSASRQRFSWILPRDQKTISVTMARDAGMGNELSFDVVLPTYEPASVDDQYYKNRQPFIVPGVGEQLIAEVFSSNNTVVTTRRGVTIRQPSPFFLRKEELGHGTFGKVFKVQRLPDGKIFAGKFLRLPDPKETEDFDAKKLKSEMAFRKEVDIMKALCKTPHDNIVQFVDEWHGDHASSIILDYMPGGTLRQQLGQMPSVQMEPGEIMNMSYQVTSALEFVHEKGIIHRDVKPDNILRKSLHHYLLADFGCSGKMSLVLSKRGTTKYMAPEVGQNKSYGFEADIWSLGVVILACLEKLPEAKAYPRQVWCAKLRRMVIDYQSLFKRYSDKKPAIQKQAIQLIRLLQKYMLQLDPANRLSAKELLEIFPALWVPGSLQAPSRIEDIEEQGLSGALSKIVEGAEFEVMTPPSVGTSFVPELEFEEAQIHMPKGSNVDRGSHPDPTANNGPMNDTPAARKPINITPTDQSKPAGEVDITALPGVGEKRKRGDQSATEDSVNEATAPGQRPTADLDSPPNNVSSLGHGILLPPKEVKRLRKKRSVADKTPSQGQ